MVRAYSGIIDSRPYDSTDAAGSIFSSSFAQVQE